jgi:peroxiredoxin Q/BCP
MSIERGQVAPEFTLVADDGRDWSLADGSGRRRLLVFYPGDNTPVCTAQLCDYRDGIEAFAGLGIDVIGISTDPVESHRRFKEKHNLPFVLLSDPGAKVASRYGVRGALGTKRALFLVEPNGKIGYAKVEAISLFRRSRDELVALFAGLEPAPE